MLLRRGSVLVALMAMSIGLAAPTAHASCAPQAPTLSETLAAAPVVFVADDVARSDSDRVAVMDVVSVWRGPTLPAQLTVHGSPANGSAVATSVDRQYRIGARYLVLPTNAAPPFEDNSCTSTQEMTPTLLAYRPTTAHDYRVPGPPPPVSVALWLAVAFIALVAVLAVVLWRVHARRSTKGRMTLS